MANRVASAARHLPQTAWLHVPTDENPADCASRGISAQELKDHPLWWSGPPWLSEDPVVIPPQPGAEELEKYQKTEAKPAAVFSVSVQPDTGWQFNFNSYLKLLHCTAYVVRFCRNLKAAVQGEPLMKDRILSPSEVEAAELLLFKDS